MKKLLSLFLCLTLITLLSACSSPTSENTTAEIPQSTDSNVSETTVYENSIWSTAVYTEDTVIGEGARDVKVSVITPEKTVIITVKTDETVLGKALVNSGLAEGEEGPYGLYIKKVNGISAVYETDGAYWALSVNGETALTGADGIELTDTATYELTYTKA